VKIDKLKYTIHIGRFIVPVVEFRFPPGSESMVAIAQFNPGRLMVAENDRNRLELADETGHVYTELDYQKDWVDAANSSRVLVTLMKVPIQSAGVGGRVVISTFPFGEIVVDSGTFSASSINIGQAVDKADDNAVGAEKIIEEIHSRIRPN